MTKIKETPLDEIDGQTSEALSIIMRHLRRRANVEWDRNKDTDTTKIGYVSVMDYMWTCAVGPVTLVDGIEEREEEARKIRVQFILRYMEDGENIDRNYTIMSGDAYAVIHQSVAVFSLLQLIARNDLKQDNF